MLTKEQLEELKEFSQFEGTEYGEMVALLLELKQSYSEYISEPLRQSVENELNEILTDIEDNFEVIEEEEIIEKKVIIKEYRLKSND